MSIYAKLNKARLAFHSLELKKSGHNKFAGYKYFELGDFVIPAMRVFDEAGLCAIVSFTNDVATMRIYETETDSTLNSWLEITSPMGSAALKGCHEVQNVGAVETYQRRYLWVAALEIVEHDALDAVTGSKVGEPEQAKPSAELSKPVAVVAYEALDTDTREFLQEQAMHVKSLFEHSTSDAFAEYEEITSKLDTETKVAFWSLFDSKQRSAIKAEGKNRVAA